MGKRWHPCNLNHFFKTASKNRRKTGLLGYMHPVLMDGFKTGGLQQRNLPNPAIAPTILVARFRAR
jgi:hypothetical protein